MNKKIWFFTLSFLLLFNFNTKFVLAQTHVGSTYSGPEAQIKQFLCTPSDASTNKDKASNDLYNCINRIYRFALVTASFFAVFMIVLAGWVYMSAEGNEESVTKAKDILVTSIASIVILSSGYVLLKFINPDLIQFQPIQPPSVVGVERGYSFDKIDPKIFGEFKNLDKANSIPQSFPKTEITNCKSTTGRINGFYQFSQCNGTWVNDLYPSKTETCKESNGSASTIGTSACGPSSMATILKYYETKQQLKPEAKVKNLEINPKTIAGLAVELNERTCGLGTNAGMFLKVAKLFGLNASTISGWANITKELNNGHPVIAAMGPGKFTSGGHFIVLHKIENNIIYIADSGPRGIDKSDITTVQKELKYAILITP
jgi:hypothetical protein